MCVCVCMCVFVCACVLVRVCVLHAHTCVFISLHTSLLQSISVVPRNPSVEIEPTVSHNVHEQVLTQVAVLIPLAILDYYAEARIEIPQGCICDSHS